MGTVWSLEAPLSKLGKPASTIAKRKGLEMPLLQKRTRGFVPNRRLWAAKKEPASSLDIVATKEKYGFTPVRGLNKSQISGNWLPGASTLVKRGICTYWQTYRMWQKLHSLCFRHRACAQAPKYFTFNAQKIFTGTNQKWQESTWKHI